MREAARAGRQWFKRPACERGSLGVTFLANEEQSVSALNWTVVASVGVPAVVVVAGWFLAHWLTARRELTAKRRADRLRALEAAFMRIATSSNRPLTADTIERLETFVSEIQLYGTPRQIALMSECVTALIKPPFKVSWDAILADLRDTIRAELRLEPVAGAVWWMRLTRPAAEPSQQGELKAEARSPQ